MSDLLSNLPNMNSLLDHERFAGIGRGRIKRAASEVLGELRSKALAGLVSELPDVAECVEMVLDRINGEGTNLKRLINATGIVLHTNLGRAPLGRDALAAAAEVCAGYCNLEYDLATGGRGSRHSLVEGLICELTGAQAAMVVNNNAAAMVLILGALAKGKKVAISRGEMVEIGGSLRLPDIIEQSGATLVEVGSTNKTRLSDYADAVEGKGAQVLLKVHTSNYEIVGFAESVAVPELAAYGRSKGLPVLYDVGSCFLLPPEIIGFKAGETTADGIACSADVICFSGDKLAGSVQSGIIAGRQDYIADMKKHPLARAFRTDKLTLAVLEATLRLYRYPEEAISGIPVLAMLSAKSEDLKMRATRLRQRFELNLKNWHLDVVEVDDETGGGALPNFKLPGWAVALKPPNISVSELEGRLRRLATPIVIRIQDDMALVSPRTLLPTDEDRLINAFDEVCIGIG